MGKIMIRRIVATIAVTAAASVVSDADADRWWSYVKVLADDSMEGRNTGSAGHKRAAEYVAAQFEIAGLEPAGTDGFIQGIKFHTRRIVESGSSIALVRDGRTEPLAL